MGTTIQDDPIRINFRVHTMRLLRFSWFDVELLQPGRQFVHPSFDILWNRVVFVFEIPRVCEQLVDLQYRRTPFEVSSVHVTKKGCKGEDCLALG